MVHPTCHPVAEKVFPAEEMVMVRSYMLGRDAKCVWPSMVDGMVGSSGVEVSLGGLEWTMNL